MENGSCIDVVPIKMVIFNSYVSLPEGINIMIILMFVIFHYFIPYQIHCINVDRIGTVI